jgi:C-terminal processing protease CtpA/Prc
MKKLLVASFLVLGAVAAHAQPDAARDTPEAQGDADDAKGRAQRDAEDARIRAQLDKARAELDRKAKEVAELSMKLSGGDELMFRTLGTRQAMLGVQVDPDSGKTGARVIGVSPGGPADEAGIRTGDVVVALDGKAIAGAENSGRALVDQMRDVKPDAKVKVRVLRDGKSRDLVVVARPMAGFFAGDRMFRYQQVPEMGGVAMRAGPPGDLPMIRQFRTFIHNEFDGLELASITPKLGAYFGATDGVLVVSAPANDSLKLDDGDVIQAIDGRKPTDGAHALRILRSYKAGEKLSLAILRQRKPMTLAVTMPERGGDMENEVFMQGPTAGPMSAPLPGIPPPPPPPAPGT